MQGECLPARCSAITLSIRTGLGGLDGGENHEGKRREEEKENILLKFGRLTWKVRPWMLASIDMRQVRCC